MDKTLTNYAGLAQQFRNYNKLPGSKWILPNAPMNQELGCNAWYHPHELPSTFKPRVPGEARGNDAPTDGDEDEAGILRSVAYIDDLITDEVENKGVDPKRILVGGFSQGCVISISCGLLGKWKNRLGGILGLSGYFPSIQPMNELLLERGRDAPQTTETKTDDKSMKWFFAHGMQDKLVSISLFAQGQERLLQVINKEEIEGHVYPELDHTIAGAEIRDIWIWLSKILGED